MNPVLPTLAAALIEAARDSLYMETVARITDDDLIAYLTAQIAEMYACTTLHDLAQVHFVASMAEKARDPNRYGEGIPTYGVEV
jgi:hypothetical protein